MIFQWVSTEIEKKHVCNILGMMNIDDIDFFALPIIEWNPQFFNGTFK